MKKTSPSNNGKEEAITPQSSARSPARSPARPASRSPTRSASPRKTVTRKSRRSPVRSSPRMRSPPRSPKFKNSENHDIFFLFDQMKEQIDGLRKEVEDLQLRLKRCEEKKKHYKYAPGGLGYQKAKEEFETTVAKQKKSRSKSPKK